MTYNRFFLENQRELINITYSSQEEMSVSYIPNCLGEISDLDYYYDFGTYASNIGIIGINVNQDWKKLPLYRGKWEKITKKTT